MGQLLSVLLNQPFADLASSMEGEAQTTARATYSEAEHSREELTAQNPPIQMPTLLERTKPSAYPWRLVDAWAFVYKGVIRIVRMDNFQDTDVIAISYTWSEDMKKWREKIVQMGSGRTYEDRILRGSARVTRGLASGDLGANGTDEAAISGAHLFFTIVAFLVFTRGKKFFWMDILCINQEEMEEKKFFVPRMAMLYRNSYETHAYPSGAEIAPSVTHETIRRPVWETRAWTVQEHILAKRVLFCYIFLGDVVDEIRRVAEQTSDDETAVDTQLNSPVVDRFWYDRGIYLLRRGEHVVSCHMEGETLFGNFASHAMPTLSDPNADGWEAVREQTSRSTMYKNIVDIREYGSPLARARLCLEMLPLRKSTCPEDMIYSAVGAFDMVNFVPEYGIGFEEARLRVFEDMGPTVLANLLGADWRSNQDGRHNDSSLPRIVGGVPTSGTAHLQSSILNCKYNRTVGTKLHCRAEKWRISKPPTDILSWTAVTRTLLSNNRLIIVQGASDGQGLSIPPASSAVLPTGSQPECMRNIVVDGSSIGISDEEYFETSRSFERLVEFVEVGTCYHAPLLAPVGHTEISLMALCTDLVASGNRRNMGSVLIADLEAFTSEFIDVVIE